MGRKVWNRKLVLYVYAVTCSSEKSKIKEAKHNHVTQYSAYTKVHTNTHTFPNGKTYFYEIFMFMSM